MDASTQDPNDDDAHLGKKPVGTTNASDRTGSSSSSSSDWKDRGRHAVDRQSQSSCGGSFTSLPASLEIQTRYLAAAEEALGRLAYIFTDNAYELPQNFPKFVRCEVETGAHLGQGSYSHVYAIDKICLQQPNDDDDDDNDTSNHGTAATSSAATSCFGTCISSRAFVASRCCSRWGEARYCLKELKPEISALNSSNGEGVTASNPKEAWAAMVDLVSETKILSQMTHPHIIKLRAVAAGNPFQGGYFLVLDHLWERLDQRILKWKQEGLTKHQSQRKGRLLWSLFGGASRRQQMVQQRRLVEQLTHAYNLAQALVYLHQNRLIHRDIKPENIGFDLRNDIKLFDFGFARQLPPRQEDDRYLLSSMTGTLRYMAPEIASGERYNEKCDVYSFSVLLWGVLTMQRPYNNFACRETMMQQVFKQRERPKLPRHWNKSLKSLVQSGWTHKVEERLTMRQVCRGLSCQIKGEQANKTHNNCIGADADDLGSQQIVRRHSTVVFPLSQQKQPLLQLPNLKDRPLSKHDLARILKK